ncbi:MAG: DUF4153 domain-containing protein [Aestuariivirgaceae bacterium]
MMLADRLAKLAPDLSQTIVRFPVCCLVALVSFFIVNLDIAKLTRLIAGSEERVYLSLAAAFLASGAGHLFAEGRRWPPIRGGLLAGALGAAFGSIYLFQEATSADPLFLFSSAALLVMTAGYLDRKASENALWLFNARFGLAVILALLVALVFCGGLTAILASLEYLFGISIRGRYYEHIWATGATIIAPIYGLSLMPRDLGEELIFPDPPTLIDRGISVLMNYVLAPMILVYLVILYLYAGKIGLQWSLPKGQIGIMVLVFGLGGTATYLIARPWTDRGTWVLRWFLASWFWLTIVPIGLLAIAVFRRISDYGVTPERYGLVIVGLWLAAMVVYFAMRHRQVASRTIMGCLGVLLFAGAFGPWGAKGLSVTSQLARFEALLEQHGYLTDGRLAETLPGPEKVPADASTDGASIINFLRKTDALDRLKPIFAGRSDDPFAKQSNSWTIASTINRQLGFRSYSKTRAGGRNIRFDARRPLQATLQGELLFYGPVDVIGGRSRQKARSASVSDILAFIDNGQLVIEKNDVSWRYDSVEILRQVERHLRNPESIAQAFRFEIEADAGTAVLFVTQARGELGGTREKLRSISFWLVLPSTRP